MQLVRGEIPGGGQPVRDTRLASYTYKDKVKLRMVLATVGWGFISSLAMPAAFCQKPATPAEITPPPGNVLFLATHANGTQNYTCQPSSNGKGAWVFFSPQATLFVPVGERFQRQVTTHFLTPVPNAVTTPPAGCTQSAANGEVSCPTWQSSLDSSAVWGSKTGSISAGSNASCPNSGAIPCLLLSAVATRRDPDSSDMLGRTTFVQRLNTEGGAAPAGACTVGDQALVPYSADYLFYKAEHEEFDGEHHEDGGSSF